MSQPLTAEHIIAATVDTYASCRSFRAKGVDRRRRISFDGHVTADGEASFTLAFSQPARFRYEAWKQPRLATTLEQYLVWCDGDDVRRWWSYRPDKEPTESLTAALAGATGACGHSALTTPALLMKGQIAARTLTDLVALERLPDEVLDSVRCYHLLGRYPEREEQEPVHFWIEQSTFLLRRKWRRATLSRYHFETLTAYLPEVNVTLGDHEFRWDPHQAEHK